MRRKRTLERPDMLKIGATFAQCRDSLFDFGSPGNRKAARWMLPTAIVAIVAATLLRIAFSDYSPNYDELASLHFTGRPIAGLWGPQAIIETNPPLFYTLLAFWKKLGAQSVVELRILPILMGTISLALTGFIANRWLGPRAGVIAVVLMGLSAPHVFYSQQLRGYILSLDGVLLSIVGLLMIVHRRQDRNATVGWGLHVAGSALAIYGHTTMFLWPVVAAAALLGLFGTQLFAERGRLLIGLIVANLAILIVASWWLWITYLQLRDGAQTIAFMKPISMREYVRQIMATSLLTYDAYDRDKLATNWIALLSVLSSIVLWRQRTGRFIVLLAVAAVIVFGIAGAFKPILMPRTIFWMSIFPVLLISGGLGALRSVSIRWTLVAVCAGLLVANFVRQVPRFGGADWREAVATIASDPQAVVLVQGTGMGSNVGQACLLQLRRPCPFPVLVLPFDPSAADRPSWTGQSVQETPLNEVRERIPANSHVYAISNPGAEPLKTLEATSGRPSEPGYSPFLEGPIDPSVVLAGP